MFYMSMIRLQPLIYNKTTQSQYIRSFPTVIMVTSYKYTD